MSSLDEWKKQYDYHVLTTELAVAIAEYRSALALPEDDFEDSDVLVRDAEDQLMETEALLLPEELEAAALYIIARTGARGPER